MFSVYLKRVTMLFNAYPASPICKGIHYHFLKRHDRGDSVNVDRVPAHAGTEDSEKAHDLVSPMFCKIN